MKWMLCFILFLLLPTFSYAGGKGTLMWPRDIGEDKWPLTVKFARIYCENLGYGTKAVYLTTSSDGNNFHN